MHLALPLLPLLGLLAPPTFPLHEDDPKVLDRLPPHPGPGWSAARAARAGSSHDVQASAAFPSQGVTMLAWVPLAELGGAESGNDCWGYVAPSGREYAVVGTSEGTAFVDVTDPSDPAVVSIQPGPVSTWRDVKVFGEHAYAVSEGGSGIQVFDLSQIDAGSVVKAAEITAGGTTATHNVAIDVDGGFLYRCGGEDRGLRIYDLSVPASPQHVGSWDDRYVHDAQVRTFASGPLAGKTYAYCCSGFNGGWTETGVSILDVTDPTDVQHVGQVDYPNATYSHQCWLSEDGTLLYLNDELDEMQAEVAHTTTHVFDVSDPASPSHAASFSNASSAVGHNLYVRDGLIFEANYRSGLRVFDASADPLAPVEVAWFDTWPEDDATTTNGLWSNHPFLPSGVVIGSDREKGLFVWWVGEPLVSFAFPGGVPESLAPGGDTFTVHVAEASPGELVPGSAKLHYDAGEGTVTADLVPLGGGDFEAQIPPLPCGTPVSFWFSAESAAGITWIDPPNGAAPYVALVAENLAKPVEDDLEAPGGWTAGAPGDTASTGAWVHGDPIGTGAQPEDDHTPAGTRCWFTGQGTPGGGVSEADVDGGFTTLLSPVYDLSGAVDARISYHRWFSTGAGPDPAVEPLLVDVSNDGGASWVNVELILPNDAQAQMGWVRHELRLADHVAPTATVQLRFVASDHTEAAVVEAAIDDLEVVATDCPDCNGNGLSDAVDVDSGTSLDLDGEGTPDECQPLSASAGEVSLSLGGTVDFALDAGPGFGQELYLLAGTTSGTAPGTPFGGVVVPLNVDGYTVFTLTHANQPPLVSTFGTLDGDGRAGAQLALPAGTDPALAGSTAHHAFVVIDAVTSAVPFASNAVPLALYP